MRTKTVIESNTKAFSPHWYDAEADEFHSVGSDAEVEEFAKTHNLPEPLVRLIVDSLQTLTELIVDDLESIWKKATHE